MRKNLPCRNSSSSSNKQRWVVPGRICLVFSSALPKSGSRFTTNATCHRNDRVLGMRTVEASATNKELPLLDEGEGKDSSARGQRALKIKRKWDWRKQKAKEGEGSEISTRPWGALFGLRRRKKTKKKKKKKKKKTMSSNGGTSEEEEEEEEEGSELCKKRILMGNKCRALNSSGNLHYGPDGILLPEFFPYD